MDRKRPLSLGIVLAAAALALAFLPGNHRHWIHTEGTPHAIVHVLIFTTISFLFCRASRTPAQRVVAVAAAVALALATEYGEHLIYNSLLEYPDMVLDGIGTVLGAVIALARNR